MLISIDIYNMSDSDVMEMIEELAITCAYRDFKNSNRKFFKWFIDDYFDGITECREEKINGLRANADGTERG